MCGRKRYESSGGELSLFVGSDPVCDLLTKLQIPNPKFQTNPKSQLPKLRPLGLGFGVWVFLGIWDLGFGIFIAQWYGLITSRVTQELTKD